MREACLLVLFAMAAMGQDPDKVFAAIRENNLAGLTELIQQKGNASAADNRGITALMYAAQTGSVEAMQLLIDGGADVNAQNDFGSTALMWSVTDPAKVRLLLEHGANVNLAAKSGRSPLITAAFTSPSPVVVRLLLAKGAKVDVMDSRHVTPMYAATFANDTATVKLLLAAGADINTPDTFVGLTPLMNAAGNRNLEAVKLLLAKGANVNAVSKTEGLPKIQTGTVEFGGWTPLLMASAFGPPEAVKVLLDAGARIDAQDYRGFTPLMLAVGTDRYDRRTIKMLVDHGADLNPKNRMGETALDWAYKFRDPGVIKALGGTPKTLDNATATSAVNLDIRTAVTRAVEVLERTNTQFWARAKCVACHEQPPAQFATAAARTHGIAIDEKAFVDRLGWITATINPTQLEGAAAIGGADGNLYSAEALVRSSYPADRTTDLLAAYLAVFQGGDGGWHLPGYSRSPLQDSDFSRTAMAMRALKKYGSPGRALDTKQRIERGRNWLFRTDPAILEDFDMRLIGFAAAGESKTELRHVAEPILSRQQPDGGWAQRDGFPSDAYATGMTLWALRDAGLVPSNDKTLQNKFDRGIQFLLRTQAPDGSWHVASRATKFQIYFESGFPYKHDQWISTMATGWAANALALSLESVNASAQAFVKPSK